MKIENAVWVDVRSGYEWVLMWEAVLLGVTVLGTFVMEFSDSIIISIENRFDENMISLILLIEKLFLTKELFNEKELKQLSK